MELGLGILGWTPEIFWCATLPEFYAAIDGWKEAHGIKEEDVVGMSRAEFDELCKKFPDR